MKKQQSELKPSYNGVKTELKPCEDAISRQAAIGIIQNWLNFDSGYSVGEKNVMLCMINELRDLPSVQRTSNANKKHVENTLEDAISRQAVDDLFQQAIDSKSPNLAEDWKKIIWVREHVKELPSVTCSEKPNRSGERMVETNESDTD